jgi:DNA (cytosine-5)-methyltransferase 1
VAADHVIPVIDLFAGPGGLGEGFSALGRDEGKRRFSIRLSIEKDAIAHQTLELRAFFRQFPYGLAPNEYYQYLRGESARQALFQALPKQAAAAAHEAWKAELGVINTDEVRGRIEQALGGTKHWVLIGGPPCQAYSLVGRSRNKGIAGYTLATDPKVRLYFQYLQILADFWPAVFVMENVKGLLSAQIDGEHIFDEIQRDLKEPGEALEARGGEPREKKRHRYELHPLVQPEPGLFKSAPDFLIRSEQYGIPQARHRVIVIGVRDDISGDRPLSRPSSLTVQDMLHDVSNLLTRRSDTQRIAA